MLGSGGEWQKNVVEYVVEHDFDECAWKIRKISSKIVFFRAQTRLVLPTQRLSNSTNTRISFFDHLLQDPHSILTRNQAHKLNSYTAATALLFS